MIEYKTIPEDISVANRNTNPVKRKVRNYLGIDVYEAAIQRAKEMFSQFDTVAVAFSGGKDSIVVLELLDAVRIDLGIEKKLKVFFWDEELIADTHVEFMKKIYFSGRFDFNWVCAPLRSEKYILGHNYNYIQWDVTREFLRPIPEWAIDLTSEAPCHESDIFLKHFQKTLGNYVICLGLRAQESLNRLNAVFLSTNFDRPWLGIENGGYKAKPTYDWSEKDIFKFLMIRGIEYAPVYDAQTWGKSALRVATPFTNEGAKNLHLLKEYDPIFYNRLITVFPEMQVQERYYKHMDTEAVYEKYGVSKEGILQYVEDNIRGRNKAKVMRILHRIFTEREKEAKNGREISCYPLFYVFSSIVRGTYKRDIIPIGNSSVTPKMLEYEKQAKQKQAEA